MRGVRNNDVMDDLLVRRARIWPRWAEGPTFDLSIVAGRIDAIGPSDDQPDRDGSAEASHSTAIDAAGAIVLPAFADVHAHLDSTRFGLPFRPHTAEPGLRGLVENDRRHWRDDGPTADRAERTLAATIASGTVMVRSHAQVDADCGLARLEGVAEARARMADRCRVQIVAFPQSGIIRDPPTAQLLGSALEAGADLIGGIDPCAFDRDPVAHLDVVFDLAANHQVGVDLHLHETGELGAFTFELIAERTKALGMQGHVTISHAFALSSVDPDRRTALIELLADADIAVTTVAPGNREPLPLDALRAAGVRVGLGQDGIRDYWSPYGNGDMLERAWQLAFRAGVRSDESIEQCVDVASRGGRAVFDGSRWSSTAMTADAVSGLAVGAPADLVVVRADTVSAAVMDHPPRSFVIAGGRVVARDGALV